MLEWETEFDEHEIYYTCLFFITYIKYLRNQNFYLYIHKYVRTTGRGVVEGPSFFSTFSFIAFSLLHRVSVRKEKKK